jgi:small-conductance mechanosensitive channel
MDPNVKGILVPVIATLLSVSVLFVVRSAAFRFLSKWAEKAEVKNGDIIIGSFKVPSVYWCVAIGLYSGIAVSEMPARYVFYLSRTIHVIVIFSITVATANLSGSVLGNYIQRSNLPIPPTGLVYGIVKGTILTVGLLVILGILGISIAPLITTLGIGGLAVARSSDYLFLKY